MISQLGRYEILSELGQGAMGVVYKAKDPLIERIVAIKTINLALAMDEKEEYEGRFYQEAKAAGRLSHPNIVTIFDVGKSGDVAYIAMEFLQGRELREILDDGGYLPIDKSLEIAAQVAQGLSYAHEHDIVHRDVKPSNIMVTDDYHVKITDFGIARMPSSSVQTQAGMVVGSPKYMSPEQVMGKVIDQRSDIFSLGVMLYEVLAGQTPFQGENINAIMYQIVNSEPVPPISLNHDIPEMANFIVIKALSKNPEERYQNAKEMYADLKACLDLMLRFNQPPVIAKSADATAKPLVDPLIFTHNNTIGDGDSISGPSVGLSKIFDSAEATMRFASLAASDKDIDLLSRNLKTPRPTPEAAKQSGPAAKAAYFVAYASRINRGEQRTHSRKQKLILLIILLIMLLGIVFVI